MTPREIEVDIAQRPAATSGGKIVSSYEAQEMTKLEDARKLSRTSAACST